VHVHDARESRMRLQHHLRYASPSEWVNTTAAMDNQEQRAVQPDQR
jgi:hypothetical protein